MAMPGRRFRPLLDGVNGSVNLFEGFSCADMSYESLEAACRSLILLEELIDRVGSTVLVDSREFSSVLHVRGIVKHLRGEGNFEVDGFFHTFAPFDGPALYSAPLFHAAELAADDINLSVDPIFLGSVSEALVVLAAPAYGASLRNLHRAFLVPTKDMRDNLAHAVASTLAARYSEAQLVVVRIGFRGAHIVS